MIGQRARLADHPPGLSRWHTRAGPLTHRLLLFAVLTVAAASLVALSLLPTVGAIGRALKEFDRKYLTDERAAIDLPPFPERSTVFAADGSILARLFADENRKLVSLGGVNQHTRDAVVAIEDHQFYQHGPVSFSSIMRALFTNLRAGEVVQGGSTITQQLAKNTYTGGEQTFARKIEEARAAIELERAYTKDEIIELYLNEIYLANGVYGIATGAEFYFGKPTKALSLPEAALLAGIVKAPESYDPLREPAAALRRRNEVLARMLEYGFIDRGRYEAAVEVPLGLSSAGRRSLASSAEPYFVTYIKQQLLRDNRLGRTYRQRYKAVFAGGLRIYTTLVPSMQDQARQAVESYLPNPGEEPPADPSTAVVSVAPSTGAIQAIVGGSNFDRSQVDLAAQGRRPAGSAFKPFALVAAMQAGVPPGRVYDSTEPIFIPECDDWTVNNAEPGTDDYMNLWDATQGSVNVVFAQLSRDVGPEKIADAARDMGIQTKLPAICSLALGTIPVSPLELTSAYGTLANGGIHCRPFAVFKVETRSGQTVLDTRPRCTRVIEPEIAAQVTAMLQRAVESGTGFRANIGRPMAGKTGTGQNFSDAWFVGYVPQMATGVWVGYPKGQVYTMENVHGIEVLGGTYPAQIWHDYMAQAMANLPVETFPPPPPEPHGTVPDVVGLSFEQAEQVLAEADFTTVAEEVNSVEPAGTVVGQDPFGGAELTLGSAVTVLVSTGIPPQVEVPNVVGLGEAAARTSLEEHGFVAEVHTEAVSDETRDGLVIRQDPAGGSLLVQGGTVAIVVGVFEPPPSPSPEPTPSEPSPPSPPPSPSPTPS
jgi:1A family penicillin-binding protein